MSVEDRVKSIFLRGFSMGKLLIIGLRPKWRSRISRTRLYSVCWCRGQPKIAISVWIFYEEVDDNRVKTKMAIEFFPCMPIQRMRVWETELNLNFCMGFLW